MIRRLFISGVFAGFVLSPVVGQTPPPPPTPAVKSSSGFVYPPNDPPKASEKFSIQGEVSVPAYSLVQLKISNATPPIDWMVLTCVGGAVQPLPSTNFIIAGTNFAFAAPPGQYLVVAIVGGAHATTSVVIEPPSGPLPGPVPPNPRPTPSPVTPPSPQPAPDPNSGGFIYPPGVAAALDSLSSSVTKVVAAAPDKGKATADARAFSLFYEFVAGKVELDGLRTVPGLNSISQVTVFVKNEEAAFLGQTPLKSVKGSYPDVSKVANDKFVEIMGTSPNARISGDRLTPEARNIYVGFLRSLANGFARAAN